LDNPQLVYQIPYLNRQSIPKDGIGAYKVTAIDGKTYHYSLPVYQKESGHKISKSTENINNKYAEEHNLEAYATHWLLTAVTGPDFIDNGNNNIGEGDLGYWVRFDYGKWSDGYTWRMPKVGYNYSDASKSYSWGVKDMYYLNSVITRTHTALFIKKLREDNTSSPVFINNGSESPLYRRTVVRSGSFENFTLGTDGEYYWKGSYGRFLPTRNNYAALNGSATLVSENWFFITSKKIKTYQLDKILLLKNENVPNNLKLLSLSSGNDNPNNNSNFEINFEEQNEYELRHPRNQDRK